MLIWKGYGWIVPALGLTTLCLVQFAVDRTWGDGYYSDHLWPKLMAVGVISASLYPLGRDLNHLPPDDDQLFLQRCQNAPHTFFYIPIEHWTRVGALILVGLLANS